MHPLRIMLLFGDLFHNVLSETVFNTVSVLLVIAEVVHVAVNVLNIRLFLH